MVLFANIGGPGVLCVVFSGFVQRLCVQFFSMSSQSKAYERIGPEMVFVPIWSAGGRPVVLAVAPLFLIPESMALNVTAV